MRWSAKLNIFLGVRNLHMDFLPQRLQYLSSYVSRKDMNPLFPVSMIGAAIVVGICITHASSATSVLKHLFLMFDVPDRMLWRLGLGDRAEVTVTRKRDS